MEPPLVANPSSHFLFYSDIEAETGTDTPHPPPAAPIFFAFHTVQN